MNKLLRYLSLVLLLLSSPLMAETVTVAVGEWKPWISKDLKLGGVVSDIITKIFKSQNYDVNLSYSSWKRSFELSKKGKFDSTGVWYKTDEREKFFSYSDEIISTREVIIYKKGKQIKFESFNDLKPYKMVKTRGYSSGKELDAMINNKEISNKIVNSDLEGLKLILNKRNRADFFICIESVAKTIILENFSKQEAEEFEFHPTAIQTKPMYLLISKKITNSDELLNAFNRGLKEFKSQGLIEKMLNDSFAGKYKK